MKTMDQSILARSVRNACCVLAAGIVLAPVTVTAQEVDSAGAGASRDGRNLEEVVVTARRKEEDLSRVPISISAIGARELDERSIRTDSDLQAAVPGLTIRQTQGNNSLTYSIRGQSADTFSGSPSAVVAYLDEVPMTVSGASTFYDLASIQVLKGPQGTLFGRNTTGGAVLYTTNKPNDEFEGSFIVRAGNYSLQELQGVLNLPLADGKVLLRGAFNTLDRDGYIDNIFNGDELGELGRDSSRLGLTIRPSDRFENTTMFSYSEIDGTNTGASYTYSVYAPGEVNNGFQLAADAGFLYGPLMDIAFGFEGAWAGWVAAHPGTYEPGLLAYVDEQKRIGHYKTRHPWSADHKGKDWLLSNTTSWEISDTLRLKNIFGASGAETDSEQPQLGAPFATILTANLDTGRSGNELDSQSLSNELQLQGEAFGGDLTYIVGLFLQRQEVDILWPQSYFDLTPWSPAATATSHYRTETDTEALYAQGTYNFTDRLALTAGARYTWEDVEFGQLSESDFFGAPDQDDSFSEPSWELGLEYELTENLFSYLKTRSSFRSGGFNGATPPPPILTPAGNTFDIEETQDVELGLKYAGTLFNRPASMNLAVYHQQIDDVQRVEFPDPDGPGPVASTAITANVPEMEVDGVEIDGSIMPADWLSLGVAYAYTDAEFTDGEVTLFGTPYLFSPVANTPEHAGTVWGRMAFGDISLYGEYYYQSSMYFSNTADSTAPRTKLPSYELINARLDWRNIAGSGFSAALFGRNLADEDHFVGGMALGVVLGHNGAAVGEPRTYGLELSYSFE